MHEVKMSQSYRMTEIFEFGGFGRESTETPGTCQDSRGTTSPVVHLWSSASSNPTTPALHRPPPNL